MTASGPDPSPTQRSQSCKTHTGCTELPPGFAPVGFVPSEDALSHWSAEATGIKRETQSQGQKSDNALHSGTKSQLMM